MLVGQPKGQNSWEVTQKNAFAALKAAAGQLILTPKESVNRRGQFPSIAHGISFGGGQEVSLSL